MKYLINFYVVIILVLISPINNVSSIERWDSYSYGLNEYIEDYYSSSSNNNEINSNFKALQLFKSLDTFALSNKTDPKLFDKEIKIIFLKDTIKKYIERTEITFIDQNYILNKYYNSHPFPYYLYRYEGVLLGIVGGYPVKLAINISNLSLIEEKWGERLKDSILADYTLLWKEVTTDLNKLIKNRIGNDSLTFEELRYIDSLDNNK